MSLEHCRQSQARAPLDHAEVPPGLSTSVKLSWWLMNRLQKYINQAWPVPFTSPLPPRGVITHPPLHLVKEVVEAARCPAEQATEALKRCALTDP